MMVTPQPDPNHKRPSSDTSRDKGNDSKRLPAPEEGLLDVGALPAGDEQARAELLYHAIQLIAQGRFERFSESTTELLIFAGLVKCGRGRTATSEAGKAERLMHILSEEGRVLACRALLAITARFGPMGAHFALDHMTQLASWFHENTGNGDGAMAAALRKLVLLLREDTNLKLGIFEGSSLQEVLGRRLEQVQVDFKLRQYLTSSDSLRQDSLRSYLLLNARPNDLPFLRNESFEEERQLVRRRARGVALRSWKHSLSFDRYSSETRRAGPETTPLLAQFGNEAFEECCAIFGSSIDRIPGRGFYLNGPRMNRLFFDWEKMGAQYEKAFAPLGRALVELQETSLCFLRGAIIVHHPDERYSLPVSCFSEGRSERYVLYVENDHFSGGYDRAALLPWKIVRRVIAPSLSPASREPDSAIPRDVSVPGFNLASLIKLCEEAGLPAVMLANISTVFGGSVAGYPKGSAPFYEWEPKLEAIGTYEERNKHVYHWHRDGLGRVHHERLVEGAHLLGEHGHHRGASWSERDILERRTKVLAPLGVGCHQVAEVAEGLFNILDLVLYRYEAWKCDLTPHGPVVPRMLMEGYRWHHTLKARQAEPLAYPIVCVADRYDWTRPYKPVFDTRSLEIITESGDRVALPEGSYGDGAYELTLWKRYVRPQVVEQREGSGLVEGRSTLLLLAREYVGDVSAHRSRGAL